VSSSPTPARGARPVAAFFISLAASTVLLGLLLVSDRRVFELKKARVEVKQLDRQIADLRRESDELKAAIEAANRHEFPAEKSAREELNLVAPGDIVLLYPPGSLTAKKPLPTPGVKR
jgi:cell division protein FtsB